MEGFLLFIILFIVIFAFKALKRRGTVSGVFIIGYAIARSISEVYRAPQEDPEWFSTLFHSTGFTYGMALSLPMLLLGFYLLAQAFKDKSTKNDIPQRKIKEIIAFHGPITVSQYMTLALTDPQFGYYQTQTPFGRTGDFITAPEISQLFGEMIGIWLLANWKAHGCPHPFILAEIGPGRGTLMDDILRTMQKLSTTAFNAAEIFLIEISEKLAKEQKRSLAPYQKQIHSIKNFDQIPKKPLFFIANEFLDTLPINQYIKIDGEWRERRITINQEGGLTFIADPRKLSSSCLQSYCSKVPNGTIFEHAPSRHQFMQQISNHLVHVTGSALLIDYGADDLAFGDTLQALSRHKFRDVFDAPGQHDLTSHVNFSF